MAETMVLQRFWRGLLALGLTMGVAVLLCTAARTENLDEGKSGPKLFSDSCAACHRSARGLAKGRFSFTLYLFLQQHYASNGTSAWALTSYLESLDDAPRGKSRTASTKPASSSAPAKPVSSTWTPQSSLRPPAPVPQR
jgi:mono/diheme cytochrome c family protein